MGTNAKNKPYCQLGKELDALARSRDVRGPYNIAHYLRDVAGYEVSGQAVSKYLYGEYLPKHALIAAFTDALVSPLRRAASWRGFIPMGSFTRPRRTRIQPRWLDRGRAHPRFSENHESPGAKASAAPSAPADSLRRIELTPLRNDDGQCAAAIVRCDMVARSHGHILGVWQQVDESLHASLCAVCGAMVLVARQAHEERWHAGGRALKQTCLLEED